MQNINKKIIIFDLDGTLVHFPYDFLYSETHRIFKMNNWGEIDQVILESCFSDFDYFRFVEDMKHLLLDDVKNVFWSSFDWPSYPKIELFQETKPTLDHLFENYNLAIATARQTTKEELLLELSEVNTDKYFSSIHYRDCLRQDWRDKSPQILRVLSDYKINPKDAILVGDTPSDVESAKKVGLFGTIAVLSGGIKEDVLRNSGANYIIKDISMLAEVLRMWDF